MLPIADWMYKLSERRDDVNRLHSEAVTLQNNIQANVLKFNDQLNKYSQLLSNNALLVLISSMTQMDDLKLADFTIDIQALPDPVTGNVLLNFMIPVTELIGGFYVMKGVVGIGKLGVNWVKSLKAGSEEAAEMSEVELTEISSRMLDSGIVSEAEVASTEAFEAGAEVTAEEVTEASMAALRATGVGILIAVGIDVILNAINGAIEKKALDEQIDKLTDQLATVHTFDDTVNASLEC